MPVSVSFSHFIVNCDCVKTEGPFVAVGQIELCLLDCDIVIERGRKRGLEIRDRRGDSVPSALSSLQGKLKRMSQRARHAGQMLLQKGVCLAQVFW